MKKIFILVFIICLCLSSIVCSEVFHLPDDNLYILVHPVEPERKGKKSIPPQDPKDNDYYEFLELYIPEAMEYRLNNLIPIKFLSPILNSFLTWEIITEKILFKPPFWAIQKNWYANDGENVISFVKFTPREYIAFVAIYYDPDIIDPGTGFNAIIDADIVLNALHKWDVDPDGEGPARIRAFDLQNILTHELGHVVGLGDLYDDIYSELTMYGYGSKGETKKRSLENGDILGAQFLYGP